MLRVFKAGTSNLKTKAKTLSSKIKGLLAWPGSSMKEHWTFNNPLYASISTLTGPDATPQFQDNLPGRLGRLIWQLDSYLKENQNQLLDSLIQNRASVTGLLEQIDDILAQARGTFTVKDSVLPKAGDFAKSYGDFRELMLRFAAEAGQHKLDPLDPGFEKDSNFQIGDADYKLAIQAFFSQSGPDQLDIGKENIGKALYDLRNDSNCGLEGKCGSLKVEIKNYLDETEEGYERVRDFEFTEKLVSAIHLACYQCLKKFEYVLFLDQRSKNLEGYCISFKHFWDQHPGQNLIKFIMDRFEDPGFDHELTIDKNAADGVKTGWYAR
jgi:hypothetical protein